MRSECLLNEGLSNSGSLELRFLGVGSAFATKNRQTNFLIVKGNDHVLVDFGMTGPGVLAEVGLKPTDIRVVLPTHSHADHVGGIECLALMNRYVGQRFMNHPKLKMVVTEEYQRVLWDYTLRGGLEWNEAGPDEGEKLQFCDFFDIVRPRWAKAQPRETWRVEVGDIHLELFRTKHIPEQAASWEASFISYGMLIDGRVFVSGDTRFDRELLDIYAERSEVLFHDVQFFPGAVHASLEDLRTLPSEIKAKMLLMHYADNWVEQDITGFKGWAQAGVRYVFD